MLTGLFPENVVTEWGDPSAPATPLYPEEAELVAAAVEKRKLEFAKGRECARAALARLDFPPRALLSGKSREPLWPAEVVGSITHTSGLCAVAVARAEEYAGVGIDAEPAEPLAPAIARHIGRADEIEAWPSFEPLAPSVVARLVFCAKEAVYKCQFPITRAFLGFEDVSVELGEGTFRARLHVARPPFAADSMFSGRWKRTAGYLMAAAWIERPALRRLCAEDSRSD